MDSHTPHSCGRHVVTVHSYSTFVLTELAWMSLQAWWTVVNRLTPMQSLMTCCKSLLKVINPSKALVLPRQGYYQHLEGQLTCTRCPIGRVSTTEGSPSCKRCNNETNPHGGRREYSNALRNRCIRCEALEWDAARDPGTEVYCPHTHLWGETLISLQAVGIEHSIILIPYSRPSEHMSHYGGLYCICFQIRWDLNYNSLF